MEGAESLRTTAPASISTLGRAVSLTDFARLAESQSSVWQARAFPVRAAFARQESVKLVVVPAGGGPLEGLTASLPAFLEAHALPGVSVQVEPYVSVPVSLRVTLQIETAQYDPDRVVAIVREQLLANFGLRSRKMGQALRLGEVYRVVEGVAGVANSVCVLEGDPYPLPGRGLAHERGPPGCSPILSHRHLQGVRAVNDLETRAGSQLYDLLPEVYRSRDDGSLASWVDAAGGLLDLVRNTLEQRLADSFPDEPLQGRASQDWLLPYFAELLEPRLISSDPKGQRAEVANAIAWRQRKGTLMSAEQIAQEVGQLEAEVQEGWKRVAVTPRIGGAMPTADMPVGTVDFGLPVPRPQGERQRSGRPRHPLRRHGGALAPGESDRRPRLPRQLRGRLGHHRRPPRARLAPRPRPPAAGPLLLPAAGRILPAGCAVGGLELVDREDVGLPEPLRRAPDERREQHQSQLRPAGDPPGAPPGPHPGHPQWQPAGRADRRARQPREGPPAHRRPLAGDEHQDRRGRPLPR